MRKVYSDGQLAQMPLQSVRNLALELSGRNRVIRGVLAPGSSRIDVALWEQLRREVLRRGEQLRLFP